MKDNKLLSVNQIYHLEVAKLMQKYALKTIPIPFIEIFDGQTRSSRVRTRSNSSLVQAPSFTQKCAQAIRCTGPKIWNSLPNDIRFLPVANNPSPMLIPVKLKPFVTKMKSFALNEIEFHC